MFKTKIILTGITLSSVLVVGCALDTSSSGAEGANGAEGVASERELATRGSALPPDQCGAWKPALVDNLEDGDVFFGSQGSWVVFNDETGSQVPVIVDDLAVRGGPKGSRYAVHSTGTGFTEWGAGFGVALGCGYDVKKYDGLRFKVKAGSLRQFALELLTLDLLPEEFGGRCTGDGCSDFYRAKVSLPDDGWYECTVPFGALGQAGWGRAAKLDLATVSGVQWNFGVADLPYDLWVDDVEFSQRSKLGCVPVRSSCK